MKNFLLLSSLGLFFCGCGISSNSGLNSKQGNFSNRPNKPGACYAKCLVPDKVGIDTLVLYVYSGFEEEPSFVEIVEVTLQKPTSSWVKVKSKNCRSADSDDCLVWCFKESPAVSSIYMVVTDTAAQPNFKMELIESENVIQKGGFTEWHETVCQNKMTEPFIVDVQMNLTGLGFYDSLITGEFDKKTKEALISMQKKNGLNVGNLTRESVEFLDLDFPR